MPGIFGFTAQNLDAIVSLDKACADMRTHEHFVQDSLFKNDSVHASRVHLGKIGMAATPLQVGDLFIWVEGEAYNYSEIATQFHLAGYTFSEKLCSAYAKGHLADFLRQIDGYFCFAIYDSKQRKVTLASDRFGMKLLYWYCKDGLFAWASDVKGLVGQNSIDKTICRQAGNCFIDVGHLVDEQSWFEHIRLIKPASIVEYDLRNQAAQQSHYWLWSDIKPSRLSFNQAVDELGERFIAAVDRRFDPNERVGIGLSGGLDSRAILAVIDKLYPSYAGYAYTFGKPKCDDIRIAETVIARTNRWSHDIFHFDNSEWFERRLPKIWNTDGMFDMLHMHGSEFSELCRQEFDIMLNGYLGDANLGGSYLSMAPKLNQRITSSAVRSRFSEYVSEQTIEDPFYDIEHSDPFFFMTRGRRFINMGTVNTSVDFVHRKPFFDNDVMDLALSVPDEYRSRNRLYSAMLQRFFPKYFKEIPWQSTGRPAGVLKKRTLFSRVLNRSAIKLRKLSGTARANYAFTNYPEWIRAVPVRQQIENLLLNPDSCINRFFSDDRAAQCVADHFGQKRDCSKMLLRLTTMEVYLKRIEDQNGCSMRLGKPSA